MTPSCAISWLVAAGKSTRLSLCSASDYRPNFVSVVEHHSSVRMYPAFGEAGLKGADMSLQLVPIGIEKVDRCAFAATENA